MKRKITILTMVAFSALLAACGSKVEPLVSTDKILVIGDELTAGAGGRGVMFPAELGTMIKHWVVAEAQEGETTEKAMYKLETALSKNMPSHLMIVLGSVDMNNQVPDVEIENNITMMITKAKENNVVPIIVGMPRPPAPNSALKLNDAAFYKNLASTHKIVYLENPVSDVLDQPKFKANHAHLNPEGHKEVAKQIALDMHEAGLVKTLNIKD